MERTLTALALHLLRLLVTQDAAIRPCPIDMAGVLGDDHNMFLYQHLAHAVGLERTNPVTGEKTRLQPGERAPIILVRPERFHEPMDEEYAAAFQAAVQRLSDEDVERLEALASFIAGMVLANDA